jgi:asparagine synthase (glutamine-hydrolysing)
LAGIAGIFGESVTQKTVEGMLNTIRHRGPDSTKIHREGRFIAGVVASDLSDERGDGFAREDDVAVFFDGDIYNQRSSGMSDSEVVLDLYKKYGRTFPAHLKGVFACAIWNKRGILLARDAVGVRPLYWGKTSEGELCFASEMKALVDIAEDLWELRPSTTYSSDSGIAAYIPHYPEVTIPNSPKKAMKELREFLFQAVEKRLEDGAVGGMLLSGGLDSSIIAAIANELKPGIPAFTVGLKDAPDEKNAVIMAKHLGIEHHISYFGYEEVADIIPKAVTSLESFEEDCISGAIANLFASSLASKHTNCILSGEGGDELYGGYHLLKDLETEDERLRVMDHLIAVAYNTALQRLDRAMMANSINYRTPFIDTNMIAFSLQIPVSWKVHSNSDGKLVEKWLLREAFKDMLPEEIYKREKLRFSRGTGVDSIMDKIAEENSRDNKTENELCISSIGYQFSTPKEFWYYGLFNKSFPSPAFEKLVGRWDPEK